MTNENEQIESLAAALEDAQARIPYEVPDGKVLVIRCCPANGTGYGGFAWPSEGPVECPPPHPSPRNEDDRKRHWDPAPRCGNGLHGWLWGIGGLQYSDHHASADARWYVVEVAAADVVDLDGKVKFPRGVVVFSGARVDAVAFLQSRDPQRQLHAANYGTATAGDRGTATAGYGGTATAADYGTATAGERGTATAGDRGTATAGERGTATAANYGTATAGYGGTATAGYGGTATAADYGTATAGEGGTATAANYGTATAGYGGTATAGDYGTATAGERGTATAGDRGTATAGDRGTATAGEGGSISILYWDGKRGKYRRAIAEVGENGIEPRTAYVLDESQKFVKKIK